MDAVGASCAVPGIWPPVTIGTRRFVDGGVRSVANADLAASYQRVVIVAPVAQGIGPVMPGPGRQAAALAAAGARVALVRPDRAAMRAIGRNVLDVSRRAAAATAGRAQATAEAAVVGGSLAARWRAGRPRRQARRRPRPAAVAGQHAADRFDTSDNSYINSGYAKFGAALLPSSGHGCRLTSWRRCFSTRITSTA